MGELNRNKITYVNFILALSIVWHHAYNINVYELSSGFLYYFETFAMNLFDISVSVFFALSGFLFYQNYDETMYKKKAISRIKSLVIPYLIWNVIGYLYFQIINLIPFVKNNYFGVIKNFTFIDLLKQAFIGDYNLITWFLRVLIIYTFIFPLFYKVIKNKCGSITMLIITVLISIYGVEIGSDYLTNCSFYYFGVFIAVNYKMQALSRYSNKQKILSATLLIFTIIAYIYAKKHMNELFVVLRLVQIVLLWISLDYFAIKKTPSKITCYSFLIFVSHEMILEPIEKLIFIMLGNNYFSATIDYLFAPIITILIILFLGGIIKRSSIYPLLTGNR